MLKMMARRTLLSSVTTALLALLALNMASASKRRIHVSEDSGFELDTEEAPSRTTWHHLLGASAAVAKEEIETEYPDLKVFVLPKDAMVTADYRTDRVRIFVDENQVVVKEPSIG
eukprot:CAMPEP_0173377946 /NCGR_PEP_ID=MMETSP1356-20130122/1199_1 /TAXON_ID=77927 ORGANISM="Hemiselmis virescens, Strain PCC157" /NCGR_SAMPLE_ID=MMETSP1356 /ASSEMBLY_ACC=CAM_ASM_000847 /LENGTH=114 /DNA_ID=CAMNT_0014330863 /DNA_START=12 /DNA_END=356 /DNA_ORIENTATION=+